MTEQLEVATEQRLAALTTSAMITRDVAVAAYGDGISVATRSQEAGPPEVVPDYSQVPRYSIAVEAQEGGGTQVAYP